MAGDLSAGCLMEVRIQYMLGVGVYQKNETGRDRFRSKPKTEYKTIITENLHSSLFKAL